MDSLYLFFSHMKIQKILIYSVVFLDVLSIWIFIPAFPSMISWYHTSASMVTLGLVVYSLAAFFAAPILGKLSDKYWRKKPLLLCVTGTVLSFLVLFLTHNIWIYILSRIINGITWGNISIIQAIITDISKDEQERAKNYGLMWALFGMWFIIWPLVGGFMLHWSLNAVFLAWTLFALIELFLLRMYLQETHPHHDKNIVITYNPFPIFRQNLFVNSLAPIFWSMLCIGIGSFSYQSVMSIHLSSVYNTSAQMIGVFLACVGVIMAINQAFLLQKFWLQKFNTRNLVVIMNMSLCVLFLCMWLVTNYIWFLAIRFITVPFYTLVQPVYSTEIIKHSSKNNIWEVTGFIWSLQSFVMFAWPLIGTLFLKIDKPVFFASSAFVALSFIFAQFYFKKTQ